MNARRIPVPTSGDINEVYDALEPGDYCGPMVGYTGDRPCVWFRLPNGSYGHIVSPPHQFRECPDGSLEVRPSILNNHPHKPDGAEVWHGYLNQGNVWDTQPS